MSVAGCGWKAGDRRPVRLEPVAPTATWAEASARLPALAPPLARLTPAERLVAVHVLAGLSNREVARTLGKSEFTVKNQVSAILAKTGMPSRARLIALHHA